MTAPVSGGDTRALLAEQWEITVGVTDFGPWAPDDPGTAAGLIAVVNQHRLPTDPKPKVFRDWDGATCLRVWFDSEDHVLDPGDHLLRLDLPKGPLWSAPRPQEIDTLRPAYAPGASR